MKSTSKLIIFIFTLLALAASAYAQSPREQLQQMVEQLQKTPPDNVLRERIVKLASELKPAPAIPEEARRPFVRANTALKDAKTETEYARAIDLYREALAIAPWWGDAYYNLAKAQELRGDFREAMESLKLFILTAPPAADTRQAQDQIYALEERFGRKTAEVKANVEKADRAAESVYCSWENGGSGTLITVDYGRSSLTYVERSADGHDTPAIVSRANVTETNISWTQDETFQNQFRSVVSYSLSRISGELDYSYKSSSGERRSARLNCVTVKPKF